MLRSEMLGMPLFGMLQWIRLGNFSRERYEHFESVRPSCLDVISRIILSYTGAAEGITAY